MDAFTYEENLKEAREILEVTAVRMAAERRTPDNLRDMKTAQGIFCDERLNYTEAVEEDLLFHLEIVEASKNSVLKSLYLKIFPDLFELNNQREATHVWNFFDAVHEHDRIIEHISNQDKEAAEEVMRLHLGK